MAVIMLIIDDWHHLSIMNTNEWNDHGMMCTLTSCEMSGDMSSGNNPYIVRGNRVYIQLPQKHPHYGCTISYLTKTYSVVGHFVYADRNGKIGFDSLLGEKEIMAETKVLCSKIFAMDPANRSRVELIEKLETAMKNVKKSDCRQDLQHESSHIIEGDLRFCPKCGGYVSQSDTICNKCCFRFTLWDIPQRSRYASDFK
jgi:hypothetical protein